MTSAQWTVRGVLFLLTYLSLQFPSPWSLRQLHPELRIPIRFIVVDKSVDFIIMSTDDDAQAAATDMCCASCGNTEGDEVKLKTCAACKLVRYCSVKCQKEHRPQHKARCKERVAELHDEILFQQPESSHLGDCPICLLPQSLYHDDATMMTCCTKIICDGCKFANMAHEMEANLESKCPFCRKPESK